MEIITACVPSWQYTVWHGTGLVLLSYLRRTTQVTSILQGNLRIQVCRLPALYQSPSKTNKITSNVSTYIHTVCCDRICAIYVLCKKPSPLLLLIYLFTYILRGGSACARVGKCGEVRGERNVVIIIYAYVRRVSQTATRFSDFC